MKHWEKVGCGTMAAICLLSIGTLAAANSSGVQGERVSPTDMGAAVIEDWEAGLHREEIEGMSRINTKSAGSKPGEWTVPSTRSTYYPHSGSHNVVNKWGETKMGIGFPEPVHVLGAWFSGQGGQGSWPPAIRAIGYRDGIEINRTDWIEGIGQVPVWLEMDLQDVDRIVIESKPAFNGVAFYGMDDLTYLPVALEESARLEGIDASPMVLDFEDVPDRTTLSGNDYAGLTWETGKGDYESKGIHAPLSPIQRETSGTTTQIDTDLLKGLRDGTPPVLVTGFDGVDKQESGNHYPPDTCGAMGLNYYVECVNTTISVYQRDTWNRISNVQLDSFFPTLGWGGDPRVMFDQHHNRWIILTSGFNDDSKIHFAYSLTSNPLGNWFKTSWNVGQGAWPDYETLGVNEGAIFTATYMVGTNSMAIFVIDKTNLLAATPTMGTVTAFRDNPWEGAIQPAETFGSIGEEYLVSAQGSNQLRLYCISPPMDNPTLSNWSVSVPAYSDPPDAPAQGSSTPLDTVGTRPMMSMWINGSLWTSHCIGVNSRAAVRWYEIDTTTHSLVQSGTIADDSLHYYFPSIIANSYGMAVIGYSGSDSSQYASVYASGRIASDPAGHMSEPMLLKAGTGPQNNIDSYGRNRWGDYSLTTVDPTNDSIFYTAQTYGKETDVWGTWIAVLSRGDCNDNGVDDHDDIVNGTSQDCNGDWMPDECQLEDNDCDANNIPDDCQAAEFGLSNPEPVLLCPGDTAEFSVTAVLPDLSYQWYIGNTMLVDSDRISGATTPNLSVANVNFLDFGLYSCEASSGCIKARSNHALMQSDLPPYVIAHPQSTAACPGDTVRLSAAFGGRKPITMQWFKNGVEVPGETERRYTISPFSLDDVGTYTCVGTGPCGSRTSNPARLSIAEGCGNLCTNEVTGDVDGDYDVDLADFAAFQQCYGEGMGLIVGCECANLDASDSNIDVADYILFEAAINGPAE